MKELNALNDIYQNQMYESKKADKDYDGDGKIESGTDEYMGSRDKAIKKAMAKKGMKKEAYTVTNADKKGNTPAYQAYKAGKKNVKTGKPMYKAADHMKEEEKAPRTQKGAMAYDGPNKERSEAADRIAAKKKKGHSCASKVKHEEYGMGDCIKEMHTLTEDGEVTH